MAGTSIAAALSVMVRAAVVSLTAILMVVAVVELACIAGEAPAVPGFSAPPLTPKPGLPIGPEVEGVEPAGVSGPVLTW
jgi:hypothetical protein